LPPDTVIETATDPYWCVTVGPANVPSLNPLAGAAVVALVVAAAAVVALLVAAAVAAFVVPGALIDAADVAQGVWPATAAD